MNRRLLESWNDRLVALTVFIIPVAIWRVAVDPIDLVKGTFLWVLALPLIAVNLMRFLSGGRFEYSRSLVRISCAFGLALVVATATSMSPWVSLFGQYQRYTGLLTLLSCVLIMNLVVDVVARGRANLIIYSLLAAAIIVVGYGLLQEFDLDPLEWSASSFSKLVFATLGNPNTASAWVSCIVPLLFAALLELRNLLPKIGLSVLLGLAVPLIGAFVSFQGQIAVVTTILISGAWFRSESRTPLSVGGVVLMSATLIFVPQLPTRGYLFLLAPFLVIVGALLDNFGNTRESRSIVGSVICSNRKVFFSIGVGTTIAAGYGARNFVLEGLRGGFIERGDFYRAAFGIWKSEPLFGSGLETFGYVFGEFRPASHAVNLESSRTSSAHSIFLGMFSNGGLILGVSYLVLMLVVGRFAFLLLKQTGCRSVLESGLVAGWLSFQIVSVISVEHVALFLLNFVLSGLVVGNYIRHDASQSRVAGKRRREPRRRRIVKRRQSGLVSLTALVVIAGMLAGASQVIRPLRAANSSYNGLQVYYGTGELKRVLEDMEKATRLAPWEAIYKLQLAESLVEVGDYESARSVAIKAAQQSFYQGGIASNLAAIVFDSGDLLGGIEIMENAVRNDPHAPMLKENLAVIKVLGTQEFLIRGDRQTARKLLEEALTLEASGAVEGLAELRQELGV